MAERPPILDRLHDVLVVLLICLRPLCWDGTPGQPADLAWQGLAVAALLIVVVERLAGLRDGWRWSWRATLAAALLIALIPAVLGAAEPAPAWCCWSGWVACGAAAGYLMQVIDGRRRLAVAACLGSLAMIGLLAAMQRWVALPAMAAAHVAGAEAFAAVQGESWQVAERIARGGVYATFTLANQLGAWLALVLPLAAALAWQARGAARVAAGAVAALGLVALACTDAKGAWLALAAGGALAWWWAWAGRWWRWLPLPLGLCAVVVLWQSGLAGASAAVRIGYWRTAAALVAEAPLTGHGLGGFAAHQPRLMLPGDEPTRFAHNEVLEAAVAGGIGLALLLIVVLVAMAVPRRAPTPEEPPPPAWPVWCLLPGVVYIGMLGALDGNLGWWPGGGTVAGVLGWALAVGICGGLVAWLVRGVALPPAWVAVAGLAAVGGKALVDFDLHAAGVAGSAALLAVVLSPSAPLAQSVWSRVLPPVLAAAVAAVVLVGMATGTRLEQASGWLAQARSAANRPETAADLARQLDCPVAAAPAVAAMRAWTLAEGAPGTLYEALGFLPPTTEVLAMSSGLARAAPTSAAIALHQAHRLSQGRDHRAALVEAERALALAPNSPRVLLGAALVFAAAADPARAAALRAEAGRLASIVHPTLRP